MVKGLLRYFDFIEEQIGLKIVMNIEMSLEFEDKFMLAGFGHSFWPVLKSICLLKKEIFRSKRMIGCQMEEKDGVCGK